jgi:glycosyltransferase involved in cell wall biosynthesis
MAHSAGEIRFEETACSVTVLMTAYNAAGTIERAIESIRAQTFRDWRMLVVDDGSQDGTLSAAREAADGDPRIEVHSPGRLGRCGALNYGLERVRSKYTAIMDADDVSWPERFAKQFAFLEANPEVKVVSTLGERVDSSGRRLTRLGEGLANLEEYRRQLAQRKPFFVINAAVMAETAALRLQGGYREDDFGAEDIYLYTRIAQNHPVLVLQECLITVRISNSSISARNQWKMMLQWARLDHILASGKEWSFAEFESLVDRRTLLKLRLKRRYWNKNSIRVGVQYLLQGRRFAGIGHLCFAAAVMPLGTLKRLARWY